MNKYTCCIRNQEEGRLLENKENLGKQRTKSHAKQVSDECITIVHRSRHKNLETVITYRGYPRFLKISLHPSTNCAKFQVFLNRNWHNFGLYNQHHGGYLINFYIYIKIYILYTTESVGSFKFQGD